jgi:hypothetical protein
MPCPRLTRRQLRAWACLLTSAGLAALAATAPDHAAADTSWLCQPGEAPNPCHESLETTVYSPEGALHVENPPLAAEPRIDCFYVYPTVSEDPSINSDRSVDPEMEAIARYQAGRFSQRCRVFAPIYRQVTLLGLQAPADQQAQAQRVAYADVEAAFLDYLANHNEGRGFVLIGHSQGTRMLRHLVRTQVDPDPEVRRRLVSAILLGANVTVKEGSTIGGDFQQVPACSSQRDTGCVIAFSTFNETPPDNSRYGRTTGGPAVNPFNFPTGPGYEVLCTNPASLAANEQQPLQTYLRSEPFPGFIGALLIVMYGGPPPSAPTPWIQPQDHYTGRCVTENGANVLMTYPVGSARRLNPSPDPSWGLHLADMNVALGDLIAAVEAQENAYLKGLDDRCGFAIAGGKGRDRLVGTPLGDRISARAGKDVLRGEGGEDCLRGQRGADRLVGGPDGDALVGGGGDDRLKAGDGARDVVRCGNGDDVTKVDRIDRVRRCETVRRAGG